MPAVTDIAVSLLFNPQTHIVGSVLLGVVLAFFARRAVQKELQRPSHASQPIEVILHKVHASQERAESKLDQMDTRLHAQDVRLSVVEALVQLSIGGK